MPTQPEQKNSKRIRVLIIHDSRHPWVQTSLLGCVLAGLIGSVFNSGTVLAIDYYLAQPWLTGYYLLLSISAAITLVGTWLPSLSDQLNVERVGLWFLCGPLLVYPMFVIATNGIAVGLGGTVSCILGLGAVWRIIEINRALQSWKKSARNTE